MARDDRIYRLTDAGRKVFWESQVRDAAMPGEYRRILGLVEFQGRSGAIHDHLRQYADKLVDEWLTEAEKLGLIECLPATPRGEFAIHAHPSSDPDDRASAVPPADLVFREP